MKIKLPAFLASFAAAPAAPDRLADLHRLRFRADAAPSDKAEAPAVDPAAGTIRGVSLLTADREASGHGVWIDAKTLQTFLTCLSDRRLKAYATHGTWGKDGTLDEVGYWETANIAGDKLRADFVALTSWKKHAVDEFDTLFELAEKLPAEFGASLAFRFNLVWVRADGSETPTVRKYRAKGDWDYEIYFDPAAPSDALRADMPSVRAMEVYSADFVDVPAANDGLFQAAPFDTTPKASPALAPMNILLPGKVAFLSALFTEAGLDLKKILDAGDKAALKTALTEAKDGAAIEAAFSETLTLAGLKPAADQSAVDCIKAAFAAKDGEITGFKTQLGLYETAFTAARIAPKPAKEGAPLTAADVTAALNARISIGAQEALAKFGLKEFPANPPGDSAAAKKIDPTLTGLARTIAALRAGSAGKN